MDNSSTEPSDFFNFSLAVATLNASLCNSSIRSIFSLAVGPLSLPPGWGDISSIEPLICANVF